jgi:sulfide:quinone oxidoreductase
MHVRPSTVKWWIGERPVLGQRVGTGAFCGLLRTNGNEVQRTLGGMNVLIAGGGVAGLEAALALRDLAGDRVAVTLLSPEDHFVYRPMSTATPFARGHAKTHRLDDLAPQLGVSVVRDALMHVHVEEREVETCSGRRLPYDALLVAIGAETVTAFTRPATWTPDSDPEVFGGLLRDIEEGYTKSVAFVVPPGNSWPLPAYELALMTAWDARGMGMDDVSITIYTPEDAPLGMFGPKASSALRDDLAAAGVFVETSTIITEQDGTLLRIPGSQPLEAQRTIALPAAAGPAIPGLPADQLGFILTDRNGHVMSSPGVWAAGDAISFPIKQGGLAAQQADAAAHSIAKASGAPIEEAPFHPILRGVILTGRGNRWVRYDKGTNPSGETERRALFWPPTKVAGTYLSPFLYTLDTPDPGQDAAPDGTAVDLDLADALPAG